MAISPFFLGDNQALVATMDRTQRLREVSDRRAQRMGAVAQRLDRYAVTYPWLEPGVSLSLSQGGVEPDQPVAQFAAQGSVFAQRYRGMGGYEVGESVRASQVAGPPKTVGGGTKELVPGDPSLMQMAGQALGVVHGEGSPSNMTSRGATAGARENPLGVGPQMSDTQVDAVSEEINDYTSKPVARTASVVIDAPYQYVQAGYRTAFRNDVPLWSASRLPVSHSALWEQTTLGQSVMSFAEGNAPDLGSGYFANPESPTEQRRRETMLRYGSIGGSVITPGRSAASQVVEPGTKPYNTLSGVVDAAVAIFGDPVNVIAGVGSGSRGIRAAGQAEDVGRAARLAGAVPRTSPIASEPTLVSQIADPLLRRRAAGGLDGTRLFTDPHSVTSFLNGPEGTAVTARFAEMDSTYDIWASTGRQIPMPTARRLRDAATPEEVRSILDEVLGVSVPAALEVKPVSPSRWSYDVPGSSFDPDDIEDAVLQFELTARNAKVDDDAIREGVEALVESPGREGRLTAFRDLLGRVERDLADERGLDPRDARMITRMWDDQVRVTSAFAQDRLSLNAWSPEMLLDETVDPAALPAAPLLDSEMINGPVPLPDFRPIRRATSGATVRVPIADRQVNFSRLLLEQGGASRQGLLGAGRQERVFEGLAEGGGRTLGVGGRFLGADPENYRLLWDTLLGFQSRVWKPATLVTRVAWPIRVALLEEQVRIAAAGMDGLYSHPISYIAGRLGRRGATDVGGTAWDDVEEYGAALYRDGGPYVDEAGGGGHRIADQVVIGRGDDRFARGVADRIATIHASVVGRNTARAGTFDDSVRWFEGEHVPWAGRLDDAGNPVMLTESGPQVRQNRLAQAGGDWASLGTDAYDPEAGRRYLEVVNDQIRLATGGDDELLDAVRTGEFRGVPVLTDDGLNESFVTTVRNRLADEGIPDAMPDRVTISNPRNARAEHPVADMSDLAVRTAFSWMAAKPSNYLNRSQVFRQAYANEMTRLVPWLDPDAQTAWLAHAEGPGNLGRGMVREIRATARAGVGDIDEDTADFVAKTRALQVVEELLYSAHRKGQTVDAMRLAFPFGEAWKEMVTTWGRLLVNRPQNARVASHGLQTASEGFFQENQYGDAVFSYPMSGALTEFVTGMGGGPGTPMPLTGRAQGLSMATEVLPGLGPAVQVPASWFIDDKPSNDWIAGVVTPYGPTESVQQLVVPRWLQRVTTGVNNTPGDAAWQQASRFLTGWMADPESQRTYNNSVMEVATYLASTGEYEQTPAGLNDMMQDAKQQAASLYIMRGLSQSFSPSAPAPDFRVLVDSDGPGGDAAETASAAAVSEWFQTRRAEHPDTAVGDFLEEFGPDAFLVMQSSSVATSVGAPVNEEGIQWLADNPAARDAAPLTFGLFAPPGGEFDYRAYVAQFSGSDREQLTLEEFTALGNNLVGGYLYRTARDEALASAAAGGGSSVSEEQRLWLKDYRERLMGEFPGYDPEGVPGVPESATNQQLVRELVAAADDPALAQTEAGRGLTEYLRFRDQARVQAEAETGDPDAFRSRQGFAATRAWLRGHANALIERYPAFTQMWDRVLDYELDEDLEEPTR